MKYSQNYKLYCCLIQEKQRQSKMRDIANNQQIRSNREKIRSNLRNALLKSGHLVTTHLHPPINNKHQHHNQYHKNQQLTEQQYDKNNTHEDIVRVRRKTSIDIHALADGFDMFECTQVFIYNEFQQIYDLIAKIDQGAQSVVYEGRQKQTNIKYAVKVFKKKDQDFINRIKTQFRILKNLNHPNIIKAYNLFVNQKIGISHLILQYSQNHNLRLHLLKHRILKQTQIAQIISNILFTLAYLHSQGVCHRDIKPENILFDPINKDIKLIDFEISKMIKYNHQKLQMLTNTGTLYYKAPEMFGSGFYSQSVDIWAIGVICYEMVMGDLPFKNLYEREIARQIKQCQPKYDVTNTTDLCVSFMKKCMSKDPLKRFTAYEALKSPFILKFSGMCSSNKSPMKKKNSQQSLRNVFEIEMGKCFDQDSGLKNTESLEVDNGIRLVVHEKNNEQLIMNQL